MTVRHKPVERQAGLALEVPKIHIRDYDCICRQNTNEDCSNAELQTFIHNHTDGRTDGWTATTVLTEVHTGTTI